MGFQSIDAAPVSAARRSRNRSRTVRLAGWVEGKKEKRGEWETHWKTCAAWQRSFRQCKRGIKSWASGRASDAITRPNSGSVNFEFQSRNGERLRPAGWLGRPAPTFVPHSGRKKCVEQNFRRAAENDTPVACAPFTGRKASPLPFGIRVTSPARRSLSPAASRIRHPHAGRFSGVACAAWFLLRFRNRTPNTQPIFLL